MRLKMSNAFKACKLYALANVSSVTTDSSSTGAFAQQVMQVF